MSEAVHLKIRINFPVILTVILALHALILGFRELPTLAKKTDKSVSSRPLNIRRIRTLGMKDSKHQDSTYLTNSQVNSPKISSERFAPTLSKATNTRERPQKLSLRDLTEKTQVIKKTIATKTNQPSKRPGVGPAERPKALDAIKLSGSQITKFSNGSDAAVISGDPRAASLSNSDIMVKLEVPEGVTEKELNEYELMFYGFQRRTAIGYINAFYKNLDKFERENPHRRFPLTEDKQIMTGRLTFDEKGNIKQIKMVRWTNVDRLQDFFVDVLKDMDTLHNPPKMLWEKDKEFTVFFSLVING